MSVKANSAVDVSVANVSTPEITEVTTTNHPAQSTSTSATGNRLAIILSIAAVYIIWGSTYLAMRFAVESFPPFMMTATRYLCAGGIMLVILVVRGEQLPTFKQIRNAALIGSLMLGVGTGGVAFAEQWVASGLAALAVAAVPVWTALFAGFWGRFPNRAEWIGLALGLSGVALLNLEHGLQANPLGALALLVGPISWAFGSMLSRQITLPSGLMATAIEMIGGGIFMAVISLLTREHFQGQMTSASVLALLYLIVFGSLIAFNAYMYLLKNVRPVMATSYAYVNPVVAVLLGVIFAGETM
ncbi:MAG TPA: drug/metabolite exporter YedA, partial [Phototrophicaceae bacterium]|nr:drug/metabolite exporter YedA [Phototrophicaceae bacterium]